MRAGTKIIVFIIIVAIIGYIALAYAHSEVCRLMSLASPSIANQICSLVHASSSALPNSQIINGSLGNIRAVSNYGSQYKVAVSITKKYNESINHLIPFTGNSSSRLQETRNQEMFSTQGTSDNSIDYQGLYVPIYENISDIYINGSSYFPSLIGKVVYIQFNATYDNNSVIQVPYIVQSEKIINSSIAEPMVYWHLVQDTGISNSTAINLNNENMSELRKTTTYTIGIYYDGTEILFPTG